VCGAFCSVAGGEVRGRRRPTAVDFYPTVSTLNQGGVSMRHRASAGEGRWPGGGSIQLRPRAGGRRTAVARAGGGRWPREMGQTSQFGRMGRLGSWLAKRFRAKNKDLNRWASDFNFELISRILSSNKIVLNIFKLNLNGV
jgi:hypothetical protein